MIGMILLCVLIVPEILERRGVSRILDFECIFITQVLSAKKCGMENRVSNLFYRILLAEVGDGFFECPLGGVRNI